MDLTQGTLAFAAITDSNPLDSFTSKSNMGTKREVVSTRLISAFFLDATAPVTISGTAIMDFADVGRKLVKFTSRALEEDAVEADAVAGEGTFAVQVLLDGDVEESGVAPMGRSVASAWAIFVSAVWMALGVV